MKRTTVALTALAFSCAAGLSTLPAIPIGHAAPVAASSSSSELDLGGMRFDPLIAAPDPAEIWGGSSNARGSDPGWHLVQFNGGIRERWLDNLRQDGLDPVQYIHPDTYVVWGSPNAVAHAAERDEVRWAGEHLPAYKVQPRWRELGSAPMATKIIARRGLSLRSAFQADGASVGSVNSYDAKFDVYLVDAPGNVFAALAANPAVYSIQPVPTDGGLRGEMSNQINAGNINGSDLAIPGYPAYLDSIGVDGTGVIMANVDGGIFDTHPDLTNRMLSCTGTTCGNAATDAHGTHTAAIMAGDGSSGVTAAASTGAMLRGLGMAPGANLVEQVYSPTFTQPGGMLLLMTESQRNGAVLSGNSWGPAGSPQGYDDDTRQVDVGVRDADPVAPGDQPFHYVLSFMNGNGGTSSQGSPDEGKNMFTIGSTKGQSSATVQIADIDDLSGNSAHGPALDGRTIPHMVAPGCSIDSANSATGHGLMCGTSMASPHVSGASGLFVEHYRGLNGGSDPSPALIRAAFIAVAKNLAGNLDADGGTLGNAFDSKQGWGRMLIDPVLNPQTAVQYVDQTEIFTSSGQSWTRTFSADDPAQPMRLMLVWTDAPGHGLGGNTPAWVNNLDLRVTANGGTFLGNVFGGDGYSAAGGSADLRNNTEGVFLLPAQHGGSATVDVLATAINGDALPNSPGATQQDFALVCYNCQSEPGFTVSADPAEFAICAPDDLVSTIDVASVLGFADPVTLSAKGTPTGTSTDFSSNPVIPGNSSTLTISGTGSAVAGEYTVSVEGVSGATTRMANITLDLFEAAPGAPTLNAPADGVTGVSLSPVLQWVAVAQATDYTVEVATDEAFANIVFAETTTETEAQVGPALAQVTQYYWRVRASNACGQSIDSGVNDFTTLEASGVLLVDDDDNGPDMRSAYTAVLDSLLGSGAYDVWDTGNSDSNEPALPDLQTYQTVIWFSGDAFSTSGTGNEAGPGAAAESALGQWLDGGFCFLLSSQDHRYDHGQTAFMTNYLGANIAENDGGDYTSVTGQAGSLFEGLGPFTLTYTGFDDFSDAMTPVNGGILALNGNNGRGAAVTKVDGYTTTYAAFPLETLALADRTATIAAFLANCGGDPPVQDVIFADGFECAEGLPGCDGGGGTLDEDFADISTLPASGWTLQNNSQPSGSTSWFQGDPETMPSQAGAPDSYIGANFNNASGLGTISNWLVTPLITFDAASEVSFWTRASGSGNFPDRLEVRLCTGAICSNVGAGAADTGDFGALLLSVNPDLEIGDDPTGANGYPYAAWAQFALTNADGLPTNGQGRIAFRYFVTDSGPDGSNGSNIGIDSVSIQAAAIGANLGDASNGITASSAADR
jgi:hypothetical protein